MLLSDYQKVMGIPKKYRLYRTYDFYTDRYRNIHRYVDKLENFFTSKKGGFVFLWGENQSLSTALACAALTEYFKQTKNLGYFTTTNTLKEYKLNNQNDNFTPSYGNYERFVTSKFVVLDNLITPTVSNASNMLNDTIIGEFLMEKSYNDSICIITSRYPLKGTKSVKSLLSDRVCNIIDDSCVLNFEMR